MGLVYVDLSNLAINKSTADHMDRILYQSVRKFKTVSYTLSVFYVIAWEGCLITLPTALWRRRFLLHYFIYLMLAQSTGCR